MKSKLSHFDNYALDKMTESKLPSLSYAFVHGQQVLHQRTMGFRDLRYRESPDPETLFGLGSVTKVFTSVAVMKLYEEGLLDLHDPVSQYVDFPGGFPGEEIRIWHLLTHSSGIPGLGFSETKMSARWFMDGIPVNSKDDLLVFMQECADWVEAPPGQQWMYLNEGYILLGAIVEAVTGQTYEEYVTDHILRPLGMTRSFYGKGQVEAAGNVGTQYMKDPQGNYLPGANLYGQITAAGGLVSCLRDMVRFTQMFLGAGQRSEGKRVLAPKTVAILSEPRVPLPQASGGAFGGAQQYYQSYSLQVTEDFFGHRVLAHGGGVMGGTSYMAFVPEANVGIVLLSNGHGYPLAQLAMYGLAMLLDKPVEALPFVRSEKVLTALLGGYETYRGTIAASVHRQGDFLRLDFHFAKEERRVIMVPESIGEREQYFFTYSGGRRQPIVFRQTDGGTELVFDRYKFRKT